MHTRRRWWTLGGLFLGLGGSACNLISISGEISGRVDPTGGGGSTGATTSGAGGGEGGGGSDDVDNTTCGTARTVILNLESTSRTGSTVGLPGTQSPGGMDCEAGAGPERIYQVIPESSGFLTVKLTALGKSFDTVLYLRKSLGCEAPSARVLCEDRPGASGEIASVNVQKKEPIFVFVDGHGETDQGKYKITFTLSRGDDCQGPIPIALEPGTTTKLLGLTPNGDVSNVACPGMQDLQTLDIVYRFSPPGLMKTITIKPSGVGGSFVPMVLESDGCPAPVSKCWGVADLPVKTTRDYVWVDGSGSDTHYEMVVTTE